MAKNLTQLRKQFAERLSSHAQASMARLLPARTYGYLGGTDPSGNFALQVPSQSNFIYCFNEVEGMQQEVLNGGVPLIAEFPVVIFESRNTKWAEPDFERLEEFAANNAQIAPIAAHTHDMPETGLYDYVSTLRLRLRQIKFVVDNTIQLKSAYIGTPDGNGVAYFDENQTQATIDLSSYQPTTGTRKWVIPGVMRSSLLVAVLEGSEIPIGVLPNPTEFEEFDFEDFEPWKVINLYNQSDIIFADVFDLPLWAAHTTGTPSHEHAADDITSGLLALEIGGLHADISATGPGSLRQDSPGADVTLLKDNLTATTAPTTGDDSGDGYDVGSLWVDQTNDHCYLLVDSSVGAAVWLQLDGGGSVSALDDLTDVIISSPTNGEALLFDGSDWVNSPVDAAIVPYTPADGANWGTDPDDVEEALDQLADRLADEEARVYDAAAITYTPADVNDWNGAADPGDANDALNQLADRVKKLPLGTLTAVTLDASGKFAAGNNRFFTISANTGVTDELVEITGLSVGDTVYLLKATGHSITVNSTPGTATDVIYTPTITPELSQDRVTVFRKTQTGMVVIDHFLHDLNSIDGTLEVFKGGTGDDLSAGFPGILFKPTLLASALELLRYNLTATSNPGAGDDSNDDYGKGSLWVNTSTGAVYVCVDASVGAAVWDRIDLQGTVTSVGLTMPADFSVANSPVTGAATLAVTANNQNANLVKAGPTSGAAAAPTYRALVDADLPTQQKLMPGGRLTLTSGTPVTTSDVTAAQSIYYTPYLSDFLALYDGSTKWLGYTFTELEFKITVAKASVGRTNGSTLLTNVNNCDELCVGMEASGTGIGASATIASINTGTNEVTLTVASGSTGTGTVTFKVPANIPVDLFAQEESGTVQPRMVQWTSSSARASALAYQNGKLVKSVDHTMLYLGSALMTGTAGQTEDSEAKRYAWNNYHRRARKQTIDDTTSHTYASTTARQWRNIATNQVDFFIGLLEDPVQVNLASRMTGNGVLGFAGWALNSTSSLNVANTVGGAFSVDERGATVANVLPSLGYNFIAALERGNATGSGPTFESFRLTAGVWG